VYHKGYDIREPIEVRVEKDRIEIVSFPGPDRSVTVEGLKEFNVFNRRYRNRRIGDFLKELQLTEGRNTGLRKILKALERNGSPLPEFETDEERSYFVTRLFIHPGFKIDNQVIMQDTTQVTAQDTAQVTTQEDKMKKLIDFCVESRTREEMQSYVGISHREHFRKAYLKPLLESGAIKMTLPDRPNSRNQKYIKA